MDRIRMVIASLALLGAFGCGGGGDSGTAGDSGGAPLVVVERRVGGPQHLLVVRADGGDPVQLTSGEVLDTFEGSTTGGRIVFSRATTSKETHLYSVPADASAAPARLDPSPDAYQRFAALTSGGRVVFTRIAPDGDALFSVPADGRGTPERLSGPEGGESVAGEASDHRLVLTTRPEGDLFDTDLYVVPAEGGPRVPIATGPAAQSFRAVAGDWIVFDEIAAPVAGLPVDLYAVRADGTGRVPLGDPEASRLFRAVTAQGRVLFGMLTAPNVLDLFAVPADGSLAPVRLTHSTSGTTSFAAATADGRVIYLLHDPTSGSDLYSVPEDGSATPVQLTGAPGNEFFEAVTPGGIVLYSRFTTTGWNLFAVPAAGGPSLALAPSAEDDVLRGVASPERAVFTRGGDELWSVPADGSGPPVTLLAPGAVQAVATNPASTLVVFEVRSNDQSDVYAVPADGSRPPVPLATSPDDERLAAVLGEGWRIALVPPPM